MARESQGKPPAGPLLRRWLLRLLVTIPFAYVLVISGSAVLYVQALLHPACPPTPDERPGYQSVTLQNASGFRLRGWWSPPQNGVAILLLGGHGANRDAMLPEAGLLSERGFGVLALEQRHCAGATATLGWREVEDVEAMAYFALSQPGVQRIGALGFSVGGVMAIQGAARLPQIEAVIAEGNFASLLDEMTAAAGPPLSLSWQMHQATAFFYWLLAGIHPAGVSPIAELPGLSPRPALLIHGENEIERTRGLAQVQAAGKNATLWQVSGADHGGYLLAQPEEYPRRVLGFFNNAFDLVMEN